MWLTEELNELQKLVDEGDTLELVSRLSTIVRAPVRARHASGVACAGPLARARAAVCAPCAGAALPRALVDRPDEWPAGTALVHVLYVVPSDGTDRALDTNRTLDGSVESFQRWLAGQSGGRALLADTFQRSLDVTFHRLARTDAEVASNGAFVRDVLERPICARPA